eukprot:652083-Pelagomonas_calceolata.AAC.3
MDALISRWNVALANTSITDSQLYQRLSDGPEGWGQLGEDSQGWWGTQRDDAGAGGTLMELAASSLVAHCQRPRWWWWWWYMSRSVGIEHIVAHT